jgi:hypothetical protein
MEEVKKQGMESLFVPYEIALALKELGFDEPCFGSYNGQGNYIGEEGKMNSNCNKLGMNGAYCTVPLYQQCWRWFREKYGLYSVIDGLENRQYYKITQLNSYSKEYDTYEEAELACLKKLIEIIKEKYGTSVTTL